MSNLEECTESLARIQEFDPQSLEQLSRLGEPFNFSEAVKPAAKLISLFKKVPIESLEEFPETQLNQIRDLSNSLYHILEQVLTFDAKVADAQQVHSSLITQIETHYQNVFNKIHPFISYSMARTVDFNSLSEQGRAAVQEVRDTTSKLIKELDGQKEQALGILEEIRKTAAEQGVSQQAVYFAEEATAHEKSAHAWRNATILASVVVSIFAMASFFFHKIPIIAPTNTPEAVQFVASKVLVFFVLTYMLFLCARNFLSHRHNQIVNKHRQNALMTYNSLVDAGLTPEARDTVLNHAASSIYRLHDTGYTRGGSKDSASSTSIIELMPKATMPLNGT